MTEPNNANMIVRPVTIRRHRPDINCPLCNGETESIGEVTNEAYRCKDCGNISHGRTIITGATATYIKGTDSK